jgi:hypothetical protein
VTRDIPLAERIKLASIKVASAAMSTKKDVAAQYGPREQTTHELRAPKKSEFVRVNPAEEYHIYNVPLLEDLEGKGWYFVDGSAELPDLIEELVRHANIYTAQTHDGTTFLWLVKHKNTNWYTSARRAVTAAVSRWVSVRARNAANSYDLRPPRDPIPEPDWSSLPPFDVMLEMAFGDRTIDNPNHPVVRRLLGIREDDDAEPF